MGGQITDGETKNEQPNWEWPETNVHGFNSQCKEMKVSGKIDESGKQYLSEVTQTQTK